MPSGRHHACLTLFPTFSPPDPSINSNISIRHNGVRSLHCCSHSAGGLVRSAIPLRCCDGQARFPEASTTRSRQGQSRTASHCQGHRCFQAPDCLTYVSHMFALFFHFHVMCSLTGVALFAEPHITMYWCARSFSFCCWIPVSVWFVSYIPGASFCSFLPAFT